MAVDFDSIVAEFQKQTEQRKKLAVESSARGKNVKALFAEVERKRKDFERTKEQFQRSFFSNQRERQAALRALKSELDDLQETLARAGTAEAEMFLADIDDTLIDTLDRDDYFDLDELRNKSTYHAFQSKHGQPNPRPQPIQGKPKPELRQVPEPNAFSRLFGGKTRYEKEVAQAQAEYEQAIRDWQNENARVPALQLAQEQEYQRKEQARLAALEADRRAYESNKAAFDAKVAEHNGAIDAFKRRYEAGDEDAVTQYISLVFARSLYPMNVGLRITHEYVASARETRLKIVFPDPTELPQTKAYRYVKTREDLQDVKVTAKENRDRYLGLVQNLSLRLLHEVWESDRTGHVKTISLTGWVDHVDPATGQDTHTQVIAAAVARETFDGINLRRATPAESLAYLGAVVSKNPAGYVGISDQYGIRSH